MALSTKGRFTYQGSAPTLIDQAQNVAPNLNPQLSQPSATQFTPSMSMPSYVGSDMTIPQSNDMGISTSQETPATDATSANVTTGLRTAAGVVTNLGNQQQAASNKQFAADQQAFNTDVKNWFDPNYNVDPDIEKLLAEMPSKAKQLDEGNLWGANQTTQDVAGTLLDPGTMGLSWIFGGNDTSTGRALRHGASEGGEGFISGVSSGGLLGGIIGGVVGTITGFFGYGDAEKADAAEKSKARKELERQLAVYKDAKRRQKIANLDAANAELRRVEMEKQSEKSAKILTRKDRFWSIINGVTPSTRGTKFSYQQAPTIGR